MCKKLTSVDFSRCTKLEDIHQNAFWDANVETVDLSCCLSLKNLCPHSFVDCACQCVIFPPVDFRAFERGHPPFNGCPIRTVIWKGRSTRSPGLDPYTFSLTKTLDELISEGTITEIFVP